ncbi:hypothetical protein Tco_0884951 [Tanacetum coccineum]
MEITSVTLLRNNCPLGKDGGVGLVYQGGDKRFAWSARVQGGDKEASMVVTRYEEFTSKPGHYQHAKRNARKTITYTLKPVANEYLKWRGLPSEEMHAYKERLCGEERVFTFPEFAVLLGLYKPSDLKHRLFNIHFNKLEINEQWFGHNEYWNRIRERKNGNKGPQQLRIR